MGSSLERAGVVRSFMVKHRTKKLASFITSLVLSVMDTVVDYFPNHAQNKFRVSAGGFSQSKQGRLHGLVDIKISEKDEQ